MQIQPLEPFGHEVADIDMKRVSSPDFERIRSAFAESGLVFFRDQDLTEADHIELAERFGSININRFFTPHPQHRKIALVVKEPEQTTNIGGGWHTDHSYDVEPALGSMLLARELPPTGGDTCFVSMYRAYEKLSPGLRKTLESLNAVHSAKHIFGTQRIRAAAAASEPGGRRVHNPEAADALPDPVHPVIIRHPLSGRKALYVNPDFTRHFEGWSLEESRPLLEYLFKTATESSDVLQFRWRAGSIALWDNRATWHNAKNDYHGHRRVMHRITLNGCALEAAAG